jgi:hypothetical protein
VKEEEAVVEVAESVKEKTALVVVVVAPVAVAVV